MLAPFVGTALLALLAVDVFLTVFQAGGRGGPLHDLQNHVLWRLARRVGVRRDGRRHAAFLALVGPALAALTIASWVLLLILSFAVLYYPHVPGFHAQARELGPAWIEALYYSAHVASTLGLGDTFPTQTGPRLLTALQSVLGFVLLSLAITYILSVLQEMLRRRTLALYLSMSFAQGGEAFAAALARRGSDTGWMGRVAMRLLEASESHHNHPILYYFQAAEASRSLPRQTAHLVALVRRIEEAPEGDACAGWRGDPAYWALRRALVLYLEEVSRYFVPAWVEPRPDGTLESLQSRFERWSRAAG